MPKHYYFIGIGGIGMSALARLLLKKSEIVSGSDISSSHIIEALATEGAKIYHEHAALNILPEMTIVFSSDIKDDNVEFQEAVKLKCPLLHRSDLLAILVKDFRSLAVAGTHGKTTTSSLLATVIVEAGLDPSFAVGGVLPAYQSNSRAGQGDLFVFEADESDKTFLKYHSYGGIVTNIDNDHLVNYGGDFHRLVEAFKQFTLQFSSSEHLFWCGDDHYLTQLRPQGQSYGFNPDCDWQIVNFQQQGFMISFDLAKGGSQYKNIQVSLTGKHNALNSAAVFGLALTLGIPEESIRRSFMEFKGVLRRCQVKGSINDILFIDDYAHHPTEIEVTLNAVKAAIKERRLIVVFQPHRYSRTKDCLGTYGNIFDRADQLIVTDLFGAGEQPILNISHQQILDEILQKSELDVQYIPRELLSQSLKRFALPNDVIVTLGAGDVTKVSIETISLIEKS